MNQCSKTNLQRNLGFILIGFGLLLIATGSYELLRSEHFCARVRVRIPYTVVLGVGGKPAAKHQVQELKNVSQNEFAGEVSFLKSNFFLSIVVSRLNLASRWDNAKLDLQDLSTAKAIASLKNMIVIRPHSDRPVLEISVISPSSTEATLIANAIAYEYRELKLMEKLSYGREYVDRVVQTIQDDENKLNRLRESHKAPPPEASESELRANYPEFYAVKKDLDFYNYTHARILKDAESNDLEMIEPVFPPVSPIPRKKTLSLILIASGLLGCGWGIKIVRGSDSTENEA